MQTTCIGNNQPPEQLVRRATWLWAPHRQLRLLRLNENLLPPASVAGNQHDTAMVFTLNCVPAGECGVARLTLEKRDANISPRSCLPDISTLATTIRKGAPCGAGAPHFPPCPFTSSVALFSFHFHWLYLFLLLSIPSLSTRIAPLRFQAGGRRKRPNLGLICYVCVICIP